MNMAKFRLLNALFKPKRGIEESGIGLVGTRSSTRSKDIDDEPQNIQLQQKYDNAYLNFPLVAAAIDIQCEQAIQNFWFEGPNAEKLNRWADKVNLGDFFYKICKCLLKNGNAWVEYPKGERYFQKILDPRWMVVYRKRTGEILGHGQITEGGHRVLWGTTGKKEIDARFQKRRKLNEIVHFKFNALNSDKYGTSLIHSILPMLGIKDRIESDLKIIVRRYAAPIIHAQVGDEMHPPSPEDVDTVEADLKDIYADTEYVTSYLIKLNTLDFKSKGIDVGPILKHIDNQIIAGLQTPAILLGRGEGTDRAIAEVQLRSFGRHIKSIQRTIKIQFEDKVIVGQGLGGPNDKLIWDVAEERELVESIDIIRGLKKDGIITAQKANSLLPPKFREKLPSEPLPTGQTGRAPWQQDQYQYQRGPDKIKDNPTDPMKVRKERTVEDSAK